MAIKEDTFEHLVIPIIDFMVSYLLKGTFVNPNITKGLNISGSTALNFNTALKIRFLLNDDVRKYLKNLEVFLRRIRTEVSREKDIVKGEVRGHIDWRRTVQIWASKQFKDKSLLALSRPFKNYDIPENIILKKMITIFQNFMSDRYVRKELERDYSWSKELQKSRKHIHQIFKNIHFNRISDVNKIRITSRMISQVHNSRKQLYRDSCNIFVKYQTVFIKHELGLILRETFIDPRNIERTYELFCLFMIIKTLIDQMGWTPQKLQVITQKREETAILKKNDCTLTIFYNVADPAKLEFYDRTEPKETKQALKEISQAYFGKAKLVTTRRPDIIIELNGKGIKDYLLCEVKYTPHENYIVEGISQTLHYLYDLKREADRTYFFQNSLGRGYNAMVIAHYLPPTVNTNRHIDNSNLKVKLFDYNDLILTINVVKYLEKFFEPYNLI